MNEVSHSQVEADLIDTLGPMSRRQKLTILVLLIIAGWGWIAFAHQARIGLAATAMNDYFSWGVYIINFVFFIGISMAGTLISAMLRLTGANWRGPITRMAEVITVISLLIAGPMIIIDMGRPDRFYMIFLHGRFQSPILWDVLSLMTYLAGSLLYLYLPMIPDIALIRDCGQNFPKWRKKLYAIGALGWRGTEAQHKALERGIFVMAIVILPVAISIHTVTAWLFGMTLRPGWHTTIIGPDFVVGALYSGLAAVITVIAIFRRFFRLERYLLPEYFVRLAKLLLVFGFVYAYFVVNEHVGSIYVNEGAEQRLDHAMFEGAYRIEFWGMVFIGLVVPLIMLLLPLRKSVSWIVIASVLVNIGMWLKRFVIVVPTLASPYMPLVDGRSPHYVPTWVEWSITVGAFAGFSLLYVLFARIFPIISIWEVKEGERHAADVAPVRHESGPGSLGVATSFLLVCSGVLFLAQKASAADSQPATRPTVQVALTVTTEDKERIIRATVTLSGKPVENAEVQFSVRRTFGNLKLGSDKTLDDGTAAVKFPADLPGGPTGELNLISEVKATDAYAGACGEFVADGGARTEPAGDAFPRSLWTPHAPLPLLLVIFTLMAGVWLTYAYVVSQLFTIWKGSRL